MNNTMILSQSDRYAAFYQGWQGLRRAVRYDIRYRQKRLHEVLNKLNIQTTYKRVMDVGFGNGDLLASFSKSCDLTGVDVSISAVENARNDPRFKKYASSTFVKADKDNFGDLPQKIFDIVISSHVLEHLPDDQLALERINQRIAPGGYLAVFVPLEEPDYIPFHVRSYSLQTIVQRIYNAGFEVRHAEANLCVNGHIWKVITIPSRKQWPYVGPVIDAIRLTTLSSMPYPLLKLVDRTLFSLGIGARQALVIARKKQ